MVVLHCCYFGGLESLVDLVMSLFNWRNKFNIYLISTSNMSYSSSSQLDTSLTTLQDNIASNLRLTLFTLDQNSVRPTRPDLVPPDSWGTLGSLVVANNSYSFVVGLIDNVVNTPRLVITDLNAFVV
jgi:hypothetical protein